MKRFALVGLVLVFMACSQAPQTLEELTEAGKKSLASGDYLQARTFLLQALKESPSDRDLLYLAGTCYLRERMPDSAHFYLKRADLLHPQDLEINIALAEASMESENWLDARHALEFQRKHGSYDPGRLENLLTASMNGEEYSFAYQYAKEILVSDSDRAMDYLLLANLASELDSPQVAISIMDTALARFGAREEFLRNKATFLIAIKDYPAAERIFRSLLKQDSTSVEYQLNLASCLRSQNSRTKSQEAYDIVLALRSGLPDTPELDSVLTEMRQDLDIQSE